MFGRNFLLCSQFASKVFCRHQLLQNNVKFLYAPAALGINGFEQTREKIKQQFNSIEDKFKVKMGEFADAGATNSTIFTEDLKHMVHLSENGGNDLDVLKRMMIKFASQNKDLRFGSYVFGPVVMRLYYYLNRPEEALDAFNDPALNGFFDQLVSYQILMDLLLMNGLYDEVINVFDQVKTKQVLGTKFPKNAVVLVLAACYLKNTPDSHEYSKNLWAALNTVGHYPMRRAATFAAALAIEQKEPGVGLEILTTVRNQTYVTVRNLKICSLADLGRPDDALPIIRNVLDFKDMSGDKLHTFSRETINKLESSVKKLNNKEISEEFDAILKKINSLRLVSDVLLKDLLCTQIEAIQRRDLDSSSTTSYRRGGFRDSDQRRPGVMNFV